MRFDSAAESSADRSDAARKQHVVPNRELPAHARCIAHDRTQKKRPSRLTSDARKPIFREDLRGRLRAFVDARDGSEAASHTAPQWTAPSISSRSANHPLNCHCSGSQLTAKSPTAITSSILALASRSSRLSLRSNPRNAGFGLDESLGQARSRHSRDGRQEFRSSTEVRCGNERLRQVAG